MEYISLTNENLEMIFMDYERLFTVEKETEYTIYEVCSMLLYKLYKLGKLF